MSSEPDEKDSPIPPRSPEPTVGEVFEAIEGTGYLLEHGVATTLEAHGFRTMTGVPYLDPDEGKSREYDVRGFKVLPEGETRDYRVLAYIMVECKNTTNPFVFFSRNAEYMMSTDGPPEIIFPSGTVDFPIDPDPSTGQARFQLGPRFKYLRLDRIHHFFSRPLKAVQGCRLVRPKKRWQVDQTSIFTSYVLPLAKAVAAFRRSTLEHSKRAHTVVMFPLVVTAGPIFEIDMTREVPTPEKADYVGFCRKLETKYLDGFVQSTFVSREALPRFLDQAVAPLLNELARIHATDPARFTERAPRPW